MADTNQRRSLRALLVEDKPGEHVYQLACVRCGREYGPEFTVFHASTGRAAEAPPIVVVDCGCAASAVDDAVLESDRDLSICAVS